MIAQVDDALRQIVTGEALADTEVEVVFEAPTKEWATRRNSPTINLYLYDIREDVRRRPNGFLEERDPESGAVVMRRPAPRIFKLSYLVTAWTQRPEDEHRLLDNLLRAFLRYDALPDRLVVGQLADPREPVKVTIGLPPPEDRAFADVWSALGGELKPSLDVVVFAPVDTGRQYPAGPPVDDGLTLDASDLVHGGQDVGRKQHVPPPATGEADKAAAGNGSGTPRARRRRSR